MKGTVYFLSVLFLNRDRIYLISHTLQRLPSLLHKGSSGGYRNSIKKIREILLYDIRIKGLAPKHLRIKKK